MKTKTMKTQNDPKVDLIVQYYFECPECGYINRQNRIRFTCECENCKARYKYSEKIIRESEDNMYKDDFTFDADAYGYMIKYKGRNIGGAGVIGRPRMHWKHARMNARDNAEYARREIEKILRGYPRADFVANIAAIDFDLTRENEDKK